MVPRLLMIILNSLVDPHKLTQTALNCDGTKRQGISRGDYPIVHSITDTHMHLPKLHAKVQPTRAISLALFAVALSELFTQQLKLNLRKYNRFV